MPGTAEDIDGVVDMLTEGGHVLDAAAERLVGGPGGDPELAGVLRDGPLTGDLVLETCSWPARTASTRWVVLVATSRSVPTGRCATRQLRGREERQRCYLFISR